MAGLSHRSVLLWLGGVLLTVVSASLFIGTSQLDGTRLWAGISGADPVAAVVLWDIRLPRLILAVLAGGALGLSGAVLQGVLRNPLADPGVIGVSASAGLGAVIAIYYGLVLVSAWAVPLFAMIGAALATLVLMAAALRAMTILSLILIGVAINAFAGALTALVMTIAPHPFALHDMVMWLMGSLTNKSGHDLMLAAPFILAGVVLLLRCRRGLDALSLGEEVAASLGVNLKRLYGLAIMGTALSVGAAVAVTGVIGFVGLVVPHIMRGLIGSAPGRLLWPSMLAGAILLVLADAVTRALSGAAELRLGVVTALLGAPFFLWLVIRRQRMLP